MTIICGIDLGTSNIRASVACIDKKGGIQLLGLETIRTNCINCGEIVDNAVAASDICEILARLEKKINNKIKVVYATISDPGITTLEAKGMVVLGNKPRPILQQDIDKSIRFAKMIMLPADKQIIHTIVHGYYLNEGEKVPNPLTHPATKLTTKIYVILQEKNKIKAISKCIEKSGRVFGGVTLSMLSIGESLLPYDQVTGAPFIVDIGSALTTIGLFYGKTLMHTESIPKGGRDLVNAQAITEFLNLLSKSLKERKYEKVIFSGGGALIENLVESAEELLGVPCEAGHVKFDWCSVSPSDSFAHESSLGVISYHAQKMSREPVSTNPIPRAVNFVNNIIEQYF